MDAFTKSSFTTKRGFTYTYWATGRSHNSAAEAPTLFFAHGWPDDHSFWQFIAPKLLASKHRILIPDLLGVGESSKPKHLAAYNLKYITQDFIEIFDHEDIDKVIVIGHDWGSIVVQRLYLYAPKRVMGMILLNVAYSAPSDEPFDLNEVNKLTEAYWGYPGYTYFHFFISEEGTRLLSEHPEKVWEICHGSDADVKSMLTVEGAMRRHILDPNSTVELKEHGKDERLKQEFVDRISRDGFETWQVYYRAWVSNLQYETERVEVPRENHTVKVPVLYVGCSGDAVARPDTINVPRDAGLLPDLEDVLIQSGHWCGYEKPEEIAKAIENFLDRRF